MDQSTILFDNQYHADVVDHMLRELNDKTWYRSMEEQKTSCQTEILSGPISDFKQDESLNSKMGFPMGSYSYFLPRRIINHQYRKEIMDKFIIPKTLISLKDTFTNKYFVYHYLFLIGDYVFIDLKLCLTQNGTYFIIENNAASGISNTKLKEMIDNYNNPYCDNRWTLEIRPKTSYCYTERSRVTLVNGTKIYLSNFDMISNRVAPNNTVDWKICVTQSDDNVNLLRMTSGQLKEDSTGKYLEITEAFSNYLSSGGSFIAHCYAYAEPYRVGYAISPNYNGPTQYLKTKFDEYLVTIDNRKLKVLAMKSESEWETIDGTDIRFSDLTNMIAVGYRGNTNWITIPMKDMVSPIHPGNFRIWEYDPESDTFGRMNATDMNVSFPNIYTYDILSECPMFYIEWIRNDASYCKFDDITAEYRDYIGMQYANKLFNRELIDAMQNYNPVKLIYSDFDYISFARYGSIHEYNVEKLKDLLNENGMWYPEFLKTISEKNRVYKTFAFHMNDFPDYLSKLTNRSAPDALTIRITNGSRDHNAYTVYVDGLFVGDTHIYFDKFDQLIEIPSNHLTADSTIIIDVYLTENRQYATTVSIDNKTDHCLLPYSYNGHSISGSDITFCDSAGLRIDNSIMGYGMYATQYVVQYPTKMINWDKIGLDPTDEAIKSRIYEDEDSKAEVLTFEFIVPNEYVYLYLKTIENYFLEVLDPAYLMVKSGEVFIRCEPGVSFSKKINPLELSIIAPHKIDALGKIGICNSDVYRSSYKNNLAENNELRLALFYGSNDETRFLVFRNGLLVDPSTYTLTTSKYVGKPLKITFKDNPSEGESGGLIYLPFPVDSITATSDQNGFINVAGTGLCGYTGTEIVFRDQKRYDPTDIEVITPQLLKCSTPNATFTFIRVHRDSNIWEYNDTEDMSFLDKVFIQDPTFAQEKYGFVN